MPRLHLKRTPAEEAERQLRKARRAARRAERALNAEHYSHDDEGDGEASGSHKRRRDDDDETQSDRHQHAPRSPSDSASHKSKPDYDSILAQIEEERFREKLYCAYDDDDRLYSVEARLNDFAHVPRRWRTEGSARGRGAGLAGDEEEMDPQYMSDDAYAEWVRAGMWR
jgi:hypothetical protein